MAHHRDSAPSAPTSWALSLLGVVLPLVGAPLAFEMIKVATAAVPASASATRQDPWPIIWFAVGVVMTIVGVVLSIREQQNNLVRIHDAEKYRAQSVTRFTDELGSTLDVLVDYSRSDGNKDASETLIKDVLREGRRLYAHDGVRLCFYMLETTVDEDPEKVQKYLVLRAYDGRRDSPRKEFSEGAHAESIIKIAQGNRAVAVVDPKSPPEGITVDHSEHSGWNSFLAIPVIRDGSNVGVLVVDTRDETMFKAEDKSIGWTISRLLTHGLQVTERQALVVKPDVGLLLKLLSPHTGEAPDGKLNK